MSKPIVVYVTLTRTIDNSEIELKILHNSDYSELYRSSLQKMIAWRDVFFDAPSELCFSEEQLSLVNLVNDIVISLFIREMVQHPVIFTSFEIEEFDDFGQPFFDGNTACISYCGTVKLFKL